MRCEGVDWTKVDCIHLDEYVGTPPASPNLPHPQQLLARCTQLTRSGSGLGFGAGMDNTHGASFAKYLKERFVDQLPAHNKPKSFTFVSGLGDPHEANRPTPPHPTPRLLCGRVCDRAAAGGAGVPPPEGCDRELAGDRCRLHRHRRERTPRIQRVTHPPNPAAPAHPGPPCPRCLLPALCR